MLRKTELRDRGSSPRRWDGYLTMEPLKITIEAITIDRILDHLDRAVKPRVLFSEDVEQMRREAQMESVRHALAAYELLKAERGPL